MSDARKESHLEKAFVRVCRRYGGDPAKLSCPGRNGMPDRVVIWPNDVTTWAELKVPGGERSALQEHEIGELLKKGHLAMFIENEQDLATFVRLSLERVMMRSAS